MFKLRNLSDITNNLDNKRKPLNAQERAAIQKKNLYPYCGANGVLEYVDEYLFNEKILCIAEDGGTWGYNQKCTYIMNEPCWMNNHAHVLTAKGCVSLEYLSLYLNFTDLNRFITGTTRGKLTKSALEKIQIPLPMYEIQVQIVNLLQNVNRVINKRQAQIAALDELTQSVFIEMFGDNITNKKSYTMVKIKDVAEKEKNSIKAGPFGSSLKKEFYVSKGYKIYGQEQVIRDDLSYGDYYIDEKKYNDLISCSIKEGDVLISLVGTFGKVSIIPKEFELGIINPRLMKVTLDKNKVNPYFFKFLMTMPTTVQQISQYAHGGTMGIVNTKILKDFSIIVPTIGEQEMFVRYLNQTSDKKEQLQKSLAQMENLYNSILQRAFKGELFKKNL
ncbi:restriction endonuclease subunit S [Bacillus mycoides]|uniref:restriction endonuclease subunit S n=1 Tax=Bacillus mycoides TaxID=1405 RepID=UPI001F135EF1|nr:restriction endonuclease subunit S [Bacillus mycoides]